MGGLCGSEKPKKYHQNNIPIASNSQNYNNNYNQNHNNYNQNNYNQNQPTANLQKKIPIDPRLYNLGAKYLIRQSKQEQYTGNIPGGKMPIKLIFSLDKNLINPSFNPAFLSFNVSFSDINNPKIFIGETLINNICPINFTFSNQIITEYFFEFNQQIKILILYNNSLIGENYVSTSKLNGSPTHTEEIPISINKNNNSTDFKLVIVSDPIEEELSRVAVCFEMRMENNDNLQYFSVFENTFNNKRQSIYKTEETFGRNPIMAMDIAFGDLSFDKTKDQEFDIVFYKRANNIIERMGKVTYSLNTVDNMSHNIISDNGNISGKVSICSSKRTIKRFVDYIYSGMQIGMICAIDFTGSNGDVNHPSSLHYIRSPEPNQYEQSIRAAAGIVAYYDNDKLFPCYGFGAEYNGIVSHCFNLNLSNQSAEVEQVEGIIRAYKNAINQVTLSGPTFFSPIIYKTIEDVKTKGAENNYYILLIITDGQITDEDSTKKAIIEASVLPISIIIVGVGTANFASMNRLDGDESPLLDARGKRIRDIVQFVHYNNNYALNNVLFSKDLLYEIPGQVERYYRSIGK
jgi:hypothetical protein